MVPTSLFYPFSAIFRYIDQSSEPFRWNPSFSWVLFCILSFSFILFILIVFKSARGRAVISTPCHLTQSSFVFLFSSPYGCSIGSGCITRRGCMGGRYWTIHFRPVPIIKIISLPSLILQDGWLVNLTNKKCLVVNLRCYYSRICVTSDNISFATNSLET